MALTFDARTIIQNSIWDWQKKLDNGNSKEVYHMIKRKIRELENMEKSEQYKLRWK